MKPSLTPGLPALRQTKTSLMEGKKDPPNQILTPMGKSGGTGIVSPVLVGDSQRESSNTAGTTKARVVLLTLRHANDALMERQC